MEKLVSQLVQAHHLTALRVYYQDVLDHVEEISERAVRMLRLCESLQEFHRNLQNERQNNGTCRRLRALGGEYAKVILCSFLLDYI